MECCEPAQWQLLTAWAARQGGGTGQGSACCGLELRHRPHRSLDSQSTHINMHENNKQCSSIRVETSRGRAGAKGREEGAHSIAGSWCERRYKRQSYKKQPPKQPTQPLSLYIFLSVSLPVYIGISVWRPALNPTDNIYCKCSNKFQNTIR